MTISMYLRKWKYINKTGYGKLAWQPEDTVIHGEKGMDYKYSHSMYHLPQLFLFDVWRICCGSPTRCQVIPLCPSYSPHSKPLSSFQRAARIQKHSVTKMLLSSCLSQKTFFSATVSKKKKSKFFINVESRYMWSESSHGTWIPSPEEVHD